VLTPRSGRPEGARTNATQSLQMMKRVVEKIAIPNLQPGFILSEGVLAAVEGPCPNFDEPRLSRQFFDAQGKILRLRRVRLRSGGSAPNHKFPRPRNGPPFMTGGAGAEPLRLRLLFPKPNGRTNLLAPSLPPASLPRRFQLQPHRAARIPTKGVFL
jgi:hypothetical protein